MRRLTTWVRWLFPKRPPRPTFVNLDACSRVWVFDYEQEQERYR